IFAGEAYDCRPKLPNLFTRFLNVPANSGADLDYALMHLRLHGFLELHLALRDNLRVDVRPQIARDRVDGLIFFFDTDREAGSHRKLAHRISTGFGSFRASSTANSATASTIHWKFARP